VIVVAMTGILWIKWWIIYWYLKACGTERLPGNYTDYREWNELLEEQERMKKEE